MVIDLFVIILGWPVFGNIDAVLYGLISTFATSIVIDKIMYGMGAGKLMIIITTKSKDVASKIDEICARGLPLSVELERTQIQNARFCCVPAQNLKFINFTAPYIILILMHLS